MGILVDHKIEGMKGTAVQKLKILISQSHPLFSGLKVIWKTYCARNENEYRYINIPHICHCLYTTAVWGVKILHLNVRKFATKVVSRQNSVNYHLRTQIIIFVWKLWYAYWIANQITHCIKFKGGWNTTPCVRLFTL